MKYLKEINAWSNEMKRIILFTLLIIIISSLSYAYDLSLFRRILINHSYFYLGYESRSELGYAKGLFIRYDNKLDYKAKLYIENGFWYAPSGKFNLGGYFIQYEPRLFYRYNNFLFGAGIDLGYTHTIMWNKINIMYIASISYLIDEKIQFTLSYINGTYRDGKDISIQGIRLDNITYLYKKYNNRFRYALLLYSRLEYDIIEYNNTAFAGQLGLGIKI